MSSRNFQWALVGHMVLSIVTSLWVPDMSTSIAALGFVALFISNVQLLWLVSWGDVIGKCVGSRAVECVCRQC